MKITIGIGGVSRSGKSTLALRIKDHFEPEGFSVKTLSQDDFVKEKHLLPRIKDQIDWEDPVTIDFPKLITAAKDAQETHDVVIVEGLFAFWDQNLNALYDKKIYLEIDKPLFLKRKAEDTRWGYVPPWFREHIWESFERYGKIDPEEDGYIRVDGSEEVSVEDIF